MDFWNLDWLVFSNSVLLWGVLNILCVVSDIHSVQYLWWCVWGLVLIFDSYIVSCGSVVWNYLDWLNSSHASFIVMINESASSPRWPCLETNDQNKCWYHSRLMVESGDKKENWTGQQVYSIFLIAFDLLVVGQSVMSYLPTFLPLIMWCNLSPH